MSQRQLEITSLPFGQQVHSLLLELVLAHLPLGVTGDKINDQVAWEILSYAATRRTSIQQATLPTARGALRQYRARAFALLA
jgi:hypothetical protein